jgi:hypothetical protein
MPRSRLGLLVLALASACNHDSPTAMPETAPCVDVTPDTLRALKLAPGIDGVQLFSVGLPGVNATPPVVAEVLGDPCARERDQATCQTDMNALAAKQHSSWTKADCHADCQSRIAIASRADGLLVVSTFDDFRLLFAPIEGLTAAATWASLNGWGYSCDRPQARTETDGVVLLALLGGCGSPETERLFKVHTDGTISVVQERTLSGPDPLCSEW